MTIGRSPQCPHQKKTWAPLYVRPCPKTDLGATLGAPMSYAWTQEQTQVRPSPWLPYNCTMPHIQMVFALLFIVPTQRQPKTNPKPDPNRLSTKRDMGAHVSAPKSPKTLTLLWDERTFQNFVQTVALTPLTRPKLLYKHILNPIYRGGYQKKERKVEVKRRERKQPPQRELQIQKKGEEGALQFSRSAMEKASKGQGFARELRTRT